MRQFPFYSCYQTSFRDISPYYVLSHHMGFRMNRKLIYLLAAFMLLYFTIGGISDLYIDYQWFKANEGKEIFFTLFFSKFNVGLIFGIIFIALFALNFLVIRLLGGKGRIFTNNILDKLKIPVLGSPRRILLLIIIAGAVAVGIIMGSAASAYWKEYLIFKNALPFDGFPADPIFGKDISFFIFSMPFYRFVFSWAMSSFIFIAIFSMMFHLLNGGIRFDRRISFSLFARTHISILLGIIVVIIGIGFRLSAYELLLQETNKFFGAGYTAVHANITAYNISMALSFIAAALLFANVALKSFKMPVFVLAVLIPLYFIIGVIAPAVLQRFVVVPNELDKERPYIANNINFTRLAYDINRVQEISFANKKNLTFNDIKNNRDVIDNIRLWDWRPLKQTYKQLQELKPYYYFNDVDVDRYIINGKKTAVNLSARELSIDRLAQTSLTWQNRHLTYTHGYGLAMNRVDRITSEGLPDMLIYDIPPKSDPKLQLPVDRPEIYYGEHHNSYVITNTTIQPGEFDYPSGDENKYTTYNGNGGVKLNSFVKRLMFSIANKDINILISGNITQESRILYRRHVLQMVSMFAPFLDFDDDPYLVLSEGRLYWIIDAFTTSSRFPYSTPVTVSKGRINYIRNSVKIIIDAYNGTMNFYAIDEKDPILKTYSHIFPTLFKNMADIPTDLQAHLRYSTTMFDVQSNILLRYHMTDPNIFYSNEDAWHIARQVFENSEEQIESYYIVTSLPDENRSEFILMIPFTPYKKNNMIAFLTAKCDMPDYGELKLYTLPKEKLSYGPLQIEARINQDPEISKQLTLWSQKGSNVIRGNMMAIPIEESILFIEPLYLKAERSEMPELKQVILSFDDKIIMESDLAAALESLFYNRHYRDETPVSGTMAERIKGLADKAYGHYTRAEQFMRAGNWKDYGEELNRLKDVLSTMKNMNQ